MTKFNLKDEAPSLAVLVAMWLLALWAWPRAADRIAIHFDVEWKANGFGSKAEGLLLLPAVASLVYAASMLRSTQPRSPAGLVTLPSMYVWPRRPAPRIGVLGVFLALYVVVVARAVGWQLSFDVVSVALGVFMIVIGNYLPKVKRNAWVGVRTPWTFQSELSWYRTHRLAGRLFVLAGGAVILASALMPGVGGRASVTAVLAVAAVCIPYSYFVWRTDVSARASSGPGGPTG